MGKSSYNPEQKKAKNTGKQGCARKISEEQWTFVAEETDRRPKCLPDFNELSGPTFNLPACLVPSDFYKKMLSDSLLSHIAECTNLRAQRQFANIHTQNNESWREVR
jgi:hypothetical protein